MEKVILERGEIWELRCACKKKVIRFTIAQRAEVSLDVAEDVHILVSYEGDHPGKIKYMHPVLLNMCEKIDQKQDVFQK